MIAHSVCYVLQAAVSTEGDDDSFSLLDAAAQGQDISSHLSTPAASAQSGPGSASSDSSLSEASASTANGAAAESSPVPALDADDQAVLETMKANAQKLPPSQQEKLAMVTAPSLLAGSSIWVFWRAWAPCW